MESVLQKELPCAVFSPSSFLSLLKEQFKGCSSAAVTCTCEYFDIFLINHHKISVKIGCNSGLRYSSGYWAKSAEMYRIAVSCIPCQSQCGSFSYISFTILFSGEHFTTGWEWTWLLWVASSSLAESQAGSGLTTGLWTWPETWASKCCWVLQHF